MNYSKRSVMGEQKNILANAQHFVSIPLKVNKSIATSGVIAAGTVLNADGTKAVTTAVTNVLGLVLNDVEVSNEAGTTVIVPVLIHGFVNKDVSVAAEFKAVLKQIMFI